MCESFEIDRIKPERIELGDLLAFYPNTDVDNIQKIITNKKEFSDLASISTEKLYSKYYSHQLLIQRFLECYDELFLFHDTGTGKSRILDLIGEHFRKIQEKKSKIQKVLVLVRSDILKSEIEKQIIDSCEDDTYEVYDNCPKTRKRALRRKINEWYTIVSYQKLAKRLSRMSDKEIIQEFSRHLIFFDEVHNIRYETNNSCIAKENSLSKNKKDKYGKKNTYKQIYRLFHLPTHTKKVIATATPIVNDVKEIGQLMNLILPEGKTFPKHFPYETASYEDYEPYFRGKISYVRGLDTGINIRYIGVPVNEIEGYKYTGDFENPQIKVFPNYMSEFQNKSYCKARFQNRTSSKTTFYHSERQSSNFVYPDGSWGAQGFKKYTRKIGKNYYPKPEFNKILKDINSIRRCSIKVANIIEISEKVEGGCVYIYDNFVKASGAITIAMCFQAQGYEIFDETSSVFSRGFDPGKKYLKSGFLPKKRIALLTGSTSETSFNTMMELMNSPENRHGEYIKVFIASPTGNEGINLNNVVSIHIVSGDWKYSTPHQAQSRAIRSKSHELLISEREKSDIRTPVNVDVYYHVAISRDIPAKSVDAYLYTLAESKDRANRRIQRFMKKAAIDSYIHASRNIRETDKPGTMENDYFQQSYIEDISPKNKIDEETESDLDYETYDVNYLYEIQSLILELLVDYFKTHFSIRVEEVLKLIIKRNRSLLDKTPNSRIIIIPPRKKYVYHTLYKILRDNNTIWDRFGNSCYIKKDNDLIFLVPIGDASISRKSKASHSYYSTYIIADTTKLLKNLPCKSYDRIDDNILNDLMESIENWKENSIPIVSKNISIDSYAKLFEREISKRPEIIKDSNNVIMDYFGPRNISGNRKPSNYYIFPEPITEIKKLKRKLIKKEQGRGRKPKCGRRSAKLSHYNQENLYEWDFDSEKVIIHNLYTLKQSKTRYADKTRYFKAKGRIRIYKFESKETAKTRTWRDLTDVESVVYSLLIQREMQKFRQFFESRSLVYGYYLNNKTLTIRNKIGEDPLAIEDKRKLKSGRVCSNIPPFSLIEMLEYLEIKPKTPVSKEITREDLLDYITQSKLLQEYLEKMKDYNKNRLWYFVSWSRSSKAMMCKILEKGLREQDLLFKTT